MKKFSTLSILFAAGSLLAQTPGGSTGISNPAQPAAKVAAQWVEPSIVAAPPQDVVYRQTIRFHYQQQNFNPAYVITPVERRAASYLTPEAAMISRASAIMAGDVDWWLDSWDRKTRAEQTEQLQRKQGERDRLAQNWKDIFRQARMELRQKVSYGDYAIITYGVVNKTTGKGGDLTLPTIFHRENGQWKATNDLRSDPLLPLSPWASNQVSAEEVFK